ncbi:MAG TPA: hypothetical protein VK742_04270 [Candidatus Sulfotelmatobacter sp.]|jgi:hypothetical protein|nr:hypothetical protein [Candidatus Sulfotelmatobacter sp.]
MAEIKHVLILANSIRAQKRCIAGKELIPNGEGGYYFGPWIRFTDPSVQDGAVSDQSTICPGHGFIKVFDIVKIIFRGKCNNPDHPEDWWFEPDQKWEFVGRGDVAWFPQLVDSPASLWHEGMDNDAVQSGFVRHMGANAATLFLIKAPAQWNFNYRKEWNSFTHKYDKRRRLSFDYAGKHHIFSVTDPSFTARHRVYENMTDQNQTVTVANPAGAYFCLSLTPEFNGKHYKIGATIFEP